MKFLGTYARDQSAEGSKRAVRIANRLCKEDAGPLMFLFLNFPEKICPEFANIERMLDYGNTYAVGHLLHRLLRSVSANN